MSEINVTPFVDVMLVLLIIFMVTAPLLTVGVQVDLPESAADSLPDDQEPLTLSINSKGEVFIQEHKVSYNKIIPKLLAIAKNRTDTRIYVRGDKNINYGHRERHDAPGGLESRGDGEHAHGEAVAFERRMHRRSGVLVAPRVAEERAHLRRVQEAGRGYRAGGKEREGVRGREGERERDRE